MQTPSAKVTTQFLVGLVAVIVAYATADQSWMEWLPDYLRGPAGILLAAILAYAKRETNPARSELDR